MLTSGAPLYLNEGAIPVALRGMTARALVEELLAMASWSAVAPVVEGSNSTSSVAVWLGSKAIEIAGPCIEKALPLTAADLIITGAVPVDVKITD